MSSAIALQDIRKEFHQHCGNLTPEADHKIEEAFKAALADDLDDGTVDWQAEDYRHAVLGMVKEFAEESCKLASKNGGSVSVETMMIVANDLVPKWDAICRWGEKEEQTSQKSFVRARHRAMFGPPCPKLLAAFARVR